MLNKITIIRHNRHTTISVVYSIMNAELLANYKRGISINEGKYTHLRKVQGFHPYLNGFHVMHDGQNKKTKRVINFITND